MTTQSMQYTYQPKDPGRKYRGIVIVVVIHVLLAWAVVSGTAKKGLEIIKKPLEAVVIQEVIIPPPPPPPVKEIKPPEVKAPKVEAPPPPPFVPPPEVAPQQTTAPAIASVATPPPTPAVIAPPPADTPAPAKPSRSDIGVACPTQVAPEMPKRAVQDGTFGVVRAQALIRDGAVREVTILSGPRIFHAAVRAAMMQYKCTNDSGEVIATQEFNFKIE
jgi:periplasmic protein TonB